MAHIHEKIDFTVCAYIVFENKILLHQHKKLNIWLPPGGHIELDEDPNEAILREVKEETGLIIELVGESKKYDGSPYAARDLVPPRFLNRHFFDTSRIHEHVNLAYFAIANSSNARHEIEGMPIRWFTRDEIDDPQYDIVPDVRFHAHAALNELCE